MRILNRRLLCKSTSKIFLNYIEKNEKRLFSEDTQVHISKLRNIGILAHIDAGKTTTTERMLFYSGATKKLGEVHHGNTVTDFLEQERERGITITSATVSLVWKGHQINIIDTPGHIDFTMEVEQALSVMDGALVILDASAGVEAQTLTVWRQAEKYNIPKLIYANKMDRLDSHLSNCCTSIRERLDIEPLVMQLPITQSGDFVGVVDVLEKKKYVWKLNCSGKKFEVVRIAETQDAALKNSVTEARMKIVDTLSALDDDLAKTVIESESLENIKTDAIMKALKGAILNQKIVPVFCGSSYKNIGVQPLMNAIISYLPNPIESNAVYKCFGNNLCAKAFKIMYDKHKGPLTFFRIYAGNINKGQKIYNIQQAKTEQSGKLYVAYAGDMEEVNCISNGNIAVVSSLKATAVGDLITSTSSAFFNAKTVLTQEVEKKMPKSEVSTFVNNFFDLSTQIPDPVFFRSIEPPSQSYQTALDQALFELQKEDPSLRVSYNPETGQTVLGGMGELHLEVIKDRIHKKYKVDVELGPLQIAYKETPANDVREELEVQKKIGSTNNYVKIALTLKQNQNETKDILKLDKSPTSASNLSRLHHKHLLAVKQGVEAALNHGPKLGVKVCDAYVLLHHLEVGKGTSDTVITSTTSQCVRKALECSSSKILQPIMTLEIAANEEHVSSVLADLSRRRAEIQQISIRGRTKVIYALAPLAELLGYSSELLTITSGMSSYSIEFNGYREVPATEEAGVLKSFFGV